MIFKFLLVTITIQLFCPSPVIAAKSSRTRADTEQPELLQPHLGGHLSKEAVMLVVEFKRVVPDQKFKGMVL